MRLNEHNQPIGESVTAFSAAEYPHTKTLSGRYCSIDKLDPVQHGRDLFDAFCGSQQDANWTYLPYGPFREYCEFQDFLTEQAALKDPLFYVIKDSQTGQAVGLASYLRIEPDTGVIEVGHIHFSAQLQRTPHATESMYLMMQRVFDTLGYRRYEWKCDALNAPSKRAAERLGFSFEGVFKKATIYKGRNRDTAWFAITDDEWPAIKQAFESWLSPNNFDQNNLQINSLQSLRAKA